MSLLVTGGGGYIGSHTVSVLQQQGRDVVILDDLRRGHREAVLSKKFYQGDIGDRSLLDRVFSENQIEAVVHFAANSLVGESVGDPLDYYERNVVATKRLVTKMIESGCKNIVFSSTAATYGEPSRVPIEENDPTRPTNPYGETKLAIERMLFWCEGAYGLKSICLRYFNAAGAHPDGHIGEDHTPETHLIPLVLAAAQGRIEAISIFGDDYPTDDGSCIRDYIHVMDLADAHVLALQRLQRGGDSGIYNLGSGAGFSVKQVIERAKAVTGRDIPQKLAPRRSGDPAVLVASSARARTELGWKPQLEDLDQIIATAWKWHESHPQGYATKTVSAGS
jgi:UDP-glucose 4-epimerase